MHGIIFIVFGDEYEKLAVKTIAYSRKFTNLPFCVFTNLKTMKPEWKNISNITFKYFENVHNRQIKTTMIDHSPFDKTLYMDVDSIITRPGLEDGLEKIKDYDLLLVQHGVYIKTSKKMQAYTNAFNINTIKYPVTIYLGGIIGFEKTDNAKKFFNEWNKCWIVSKEKREMPALACAIQRLNTLLKIKLIPHLFSWRNINLKSIIQHEYKDSWWNEYYPQVGVNRIRITPEALHESV